MLRDHKVLVLVHEHLARIRHQARIVVHRKGRGRPLGGCKAAVLRQPGAQRVRQILPPGSRVSAAEARVQLCSGGKHAQGTAPCLVPPMCVLAAEAECGVSHPSTCGTRRAFWSVLWIGTARLKP